MKSTILRLTGLVALSTSAVAQVGVEGFETGNPDSWELWFSAYNSVVPAGGNPGAYLELDDFTSGPATCHFVRIFPDPNGAGFMHSGDWRAAGVDSVSIDIDVQQGLFQGDVTLRLVSDPGTPGMTMDDCVVLLNLPMAGSSAPGWQTYSFTVPSTQTTLPFGWEVETTSPCSLGSPDVAWNTVIQDVDWIEFRYDGNPPVFCQFTNWLFGVDNITVNGIGSVLGTNYCAAENNSTGVPAVLSGTGSVMVSDNDVTLTCGSMPSNSFGFFLTSQQQGFVTNPGGSSGNLCLGGAIGRYVGPGQIQNSGSTGEISLTVDLTQHPTPTGLVAVQPGETWNFTAWFRDTSPIGATSNFGDGYEISFL